MEELGSKSDLDQKEKTSVWNEGKFQIYRLHILWLSCNTTSSAGKLEEWKWKLDNIWRELTPSAKKRDKNRNSDEQYFHINQIHKDKIAEAGNDSEIYTALEDREIFLRILQDEVGKGSSEMEKESEDFDE